jgi:hypothetical protein
LDEWRTEEAKGCRLRALGFQFSKEVLSQNFPHVSAIPTEGIALTVTAPLSELVEGAGITPALYIVYL